MNTSDGMLTVWLTDRRILNLPLACYPTLAHATTAELNRWEPSGAGRGIHWPALDYDLSIDGLLAGLREHPEAKRIVQKAKMKIRPAKKTTLRPGARARSRKSATGIPG